MKLYRKILIIIPGILLSFPSCNRNDLNLPPPTQSETSFFNTESDFRTAIIGVYAAMTDFYASSNLTGGGSWEGEIQFLTGDDLTINASEPFEILGNGINPANAKISQYFSSCYVLLNRANKIMQKITETKAGVYTTPNLQQYNQGEMFFLRGFGHYQLWNIFGTAPLDTTVITSVAGLTPPSSKGTELLDQAITDLTKAASLLPSSPWGAADVGRVTANAAYGLLGKCLVFRGTVNKSAADFQAALDAFGKLTGLSLTTNFEDNFDVNKENNQESLFEFQAGVPILGAGSTNAWLSNDQANIGVAGAYWQSFGPGNFTSYMGGGVYSVTAKLVNSFDAGDPRIPFTFTGTTINKYILNDKGEGPANSVNNPRILRYADILLLQAEALVQSGGSSSQAVGLINQVRARARNMVPGSTVPADLDNSVTDKGTIMQWIMDERFRELAAEGQRWYDLRRWALSGTITLNSAFFNSIALDQNGNSLTNYDAHYLNFPIPNSETQKNAKIIQNTGY